jgi:hypothetical protein
MLALPGATPVTMPPDTVAMPVLLLLHVPPLTLLVNVVVDPSHTTDVPDMLPGDGAVLTVSTLVTIQPLRV